MPLINCLAVRVIIAPQPGFKTSNAVLDHQRSSSLLHRLRPSLLAVLLVPLVFIFASCGEDPVEQPQVGFDQKKWLIKEDGKYPYRKQMIKDLLTNYKWTGLAKDSVVKILGKEDAIEEGNLTYYYESKPMLGGLGTSIETVVFEMTPEGIVKLARLNDGGWD